MGYDLRDGLLPPVEFARVDFHLEFLESFEISLGVLLRLRRGLHQAARETFGADGVTGEERFVRLFDPGLSTDPASLRRHQRPAPPFAIQPIPDIEGPREAGDRLRLPVHFFGAGIQGVPDFARVLQRLGRHGLFHAMGTFELIAIEAEDTSGAKQGVWREGEPLVDLAMPLIDVSWWLENQAAAGSGKSLVFFTPARLLSGGKPLFRPSFSNLFPFALRRVTSMLHAHYGYEFEEPQEMIAEANAIAVESGGLRWTDWRTLEDGIKGQDLGGVTGKLRFGPRLPESLFSLLGLASMMNLGKGAAFGSGCFRLES